MLPTSQAGQPSAAWQLKIEGQDAGRMELWRTSRGWAWAWAQKPWSLIPLLGIVSDLDPLEKDPWTFGDKTDALDHLMTTCGSAFGSRCVLVAAASQA